MYKSMYICIARNNIELKKVTNKQKHELFQCKFAIEINVTTSKFFLDMSTKIEQKFSQGFAKQ